MQPPRRKDDPADARKDDDPERSIPDERRPEQPPPPEQRREEQPRGHRLTSSERRAATQRLVREGALDGLKNLPLPPPPPARGRGVVPSTPRDTERELTETEDLTVDPNEETGEIHGRSAAGDTPRPRPRPNIRGLSSDGDEQDLRGEIARRVRSAPRGAAPPTDRARLLRLLEINKALNGQLELGPLLDMIMDAAISLSNARRGFLVLWDRGEARVVRARNIDKAVIDSPESAISRHLIREAIDRRETVVTAEASLERGGYASVNSLDLKSVMVSPLLSRGRVIGVIYLDDPDKVGVFQTDDVRTVEAFCDQAAIALANAYKLEEMNERYESQRFRLKRVEAEVRKKDQDEIRRFGNIVGASSAMRKVFELMGRVVESNFPVVITGESGTGKELVAKAIHYNGNRKDAAFVATNCAALPETLLDSELFGFVAGAFTGAVRDRKGLFEQADGGTLFLDEIEEMSPGMQGKLLRVLQEGEVRRVGAKVTRRVDVRCLCATNRDLRAMVEKGEFRRDLYYRLNVIPIVIPPLRDRREDIPHLLGDILAKLDGADASGPPLQIDKDALELLIKYDWPGNVRELENELKRMVALGARRIRISDLAPRILSPQAPGKPERGESPGDLPTLNLRQIERVAIEKALNEAGNNKTQAAKVLGLSRRGLLKKLERYKIASASSEEAASLLDPDEPAAGAADEIVAEDDETDVE